MTPDPPAHDGAWEQRRRQIWRTALAIGVSTGAYGFSFGAISTAAGLSLAQTAVLSAVMFTGASQFALVAVLASGGGAAVAAGTAALLGARNAFYGLSLSPVLGVTGVRRVVAAHLVIDESAAVSLAAATDVPPGDDRAGRFGFWAAGGSVFVLWNLATVLGAVAADALPDPAQLGLDAAVPAAFLALLAPRLRDSAVRVPAGMAAVVGLALTPLVPIGLPILAAALVVIAWGAATQGRSR